MTTRVACVGAVVRDGSGALLLVRRGREPARGTWSLPGGRVEAGEDEPGAVSREVLEETGLVVEVGAWVGSVERQGPPGVVYVVQDYAATPVGGRLAAGDDADEVGWFSPAEVLQLETSPGLVETLLAWHVL